MITRESLAFTLIADGLLLAQLGHQFADRLIRPSSVKNSGEKQIIIEAQDLGMAHSIDEASFKALEMGWITSAGVLVPAPWFPEVVRWTKAHPDVDVDLQLDLNAEWASFRWRPTAPQPFNYGLSDPAGYLPNDVRYIAEHAKPEEVAAEFRSQVNAAHQAHLSVTCVDSHGGIELFTPWLFDEYWKAATEAGLPALLSKESVLQRGKPTRKPNIYDMAGIEIDITTIPIDRIIKMEPGFKAIDWLNAYERTLTALPPGTYLLQVHLGIADDELKAMTVDHPHWGAEWRQNDYDVISSPDFHKFLIDNDFVLIRWKDLQKSHADK
jgi:predicted glycoside hydrolase/deacetylase ChbG (UPF0249 family)